MLDRKELEDALDDLEEAAYWHGFAKADGRHGRDESDERNKARQKVLALIFKANNDSSN